AEILAALMRHDIVSAAADEEMIQVMARQQYNSMIPRGVPDGSTVAHKTGWITGIRHDAGIVYPPDSAPYTLVILTETPTDEDGNLAYSDEEVVSIVAGLARRVHEAVRGTP
ncbi:MAG: serine hydrolase, partial [Bacteroidota bacterium]